MKYYLCTAAVMLSSLLPAYAERAQQADQLVNSVGVNTHLTYTNTPYYQQWPQILADLKGLHIRHIRDGYYNWPANTIYYKEHQLLASNGIDCDFVVGTTAPTPNQVASFKALAGDVAFLEAPNEMDDQKGLNWAAVLQNELPQLYTSANASQIPVLGPSLVYKQSYPVLGDQSSNINYNNLHVYFGGRNPGSNGWGSGDAQGHSYGSIAWWLDNAQIDAPGVPSIITESGYLSNPVVTPYTLPQNIEAKYVPRTILEAFNAGVTRTYFYEMVDELSSPGYGLMDQNLNPKLAYTAISNLLGLLTDPGASFQPGVLNYNLIGAASDVHHLLLQKRDGTFYLALWIEESGYNPAINLVTPVATQNVQLVLNGGVARNIYQLSDQGTLTSTTVNNAATLPLTLSDTVTIVQIGAAAPTPTPSVAPGTAPVVANGAHVIVNESSRLLLDDSASSRTPGTQMIEWKANGGANQSWLFTYSSGGYYIQNKTSGLMLTDIQPASSSASNAVQESLNTTPNQIWSLSASGSGWLFVNKATGRILTNPNSSNALGTGIVLASRAGGNNQVWTIQ